MSRYAVIGSNSFSGSHLVDLLLEDSPNQVTGISRSPEKNPVFLPYKRHATGRFFFHALNINRDMPAIARVLDDFKPEFVINFAAQGEVQTSWQYPDQWFETNAVGISKLCHFLKDRPYLKRYIHISTPEVYGNCPVPVKENAPLNPSTPYAVSKAAGDLYLFTLVKQYRFPLVMIRSTNVYGPHQQLYRIIPRSIVYLKTGRKIPLEGGGRAFKAYIHIKDVCRGILSAAHSGREGEIYHFSPDEDISIAGLVARICQKMGCDFTAGTQAAADRPGQDACYRIDSSKARKELSWRPTVGLDQGLEEVIGWIDGRWNEISGENQEYVHIP